MKIKIKILLVLSLLGLTSCSVFKKNPKPAPPVSMDPSTEELAEGLPEDPVVLDAAGISKLDPVTRILVEDAHESGRPMILFPGKPEEQEEDAQ